jgi:hypothetical protein
LSSERVKIATEIAKRGGSIRAPPDLEEPTMSNEEPVSIRLPTALLDRAERLAKKLAADPTHSSVFRVTRAAALRMALLRGVEALEEDLAKKVKK